MNNVIWTKQSLAHALNTRMDQGKFEANEFIMIPDITDEVLMEWQTFYDTNKSNPMVIEGEYINVYQSILAGFQE